MLLAANAAGTDKLRPLVIGHAKRPRCFKNVNIDNLPVIYQYNSKAWMRMDIWESWLQRINSIFRNEDRNVLLLVDNAPSHTANSFEDEDSSTAEADANEGSLQLSNIRVEYLPPNTTAHLQPMDGGIIKSFKAKYKHYYCRHILELFENKRDLERQVLFLDLITFCICILYAC